MITIIDSGVANIGSVMAACHRIGVPAQVTNDPAVVRSAGALILPGVGAFADGMASLRKHRLEQPIREAAAAGVPILGICLGMQLLAEISEEFGEHGGLGLISGRVMRLQPADSERVPNIGWWDISIAKNARLFAGIEDGSAFYFVHSYYLSCTDTQDSVASIAFGSGAVTIAIERGNIFGVQFHPEKSQDLGLQLLDNFARLL
jgi:glutamine amidotransferase